MTATTNLFSLSGAQLRAEPNNPAYVAELARRMAKREAAGKVTVAALKSWGRMDDAAAIVAKAQPAPKAPKASKGDAAADKAMRKGKGVMGAMIAAVKADPAYLGTPAVAKPKAVAFTRTNERVDMLTTRVESIEKSVLSLAESQASMLKALDLISKKLGC